MSSTRPLILRIITRLGAGGPPIHAITATRALDKAGFRTILVTGSLSEQDGDMSYLLDDADPILRIPEMSRNVSLWNDLRALWKLYTLMRQLQPDVVHTHTAKAGMLGRVAALAAGVPAIVHTFHGNVFSGYFPRPVNLCIQMIERTLARFSNSVCVLSSQQAGEIVSRYRIAPESKVRVVPLGMELSAFQELPLPSPECGALTVGWLGRFVSIKDAGLLVATARRAIAQNSRIRFVVAGDGPDLPVIQDAERELGSAFRWVGWQQDVLPVIAECDVLLQTSRNEGTPVALIQGMSAGRPFVSTAVGGVTGMVQGTERLSDCGRWFSNAVLTEASATAMAEVLCDLAANPVLVRTMGQNARSFVAAQYTVESLVSGLCNLYTSLLHADAHPHRFHSRESDSRLRPVPAEEKSTSLWSV